MAQLALIASVISAVGQIKAGQDQKAMYQAQAKQEEIKGRTEAIRARQEGVKTLDSLQRTLATINARGRAGAIDPASGSAGSLQTYALREGYTEFDISQENAKLAAASAGFQANIYRASGQAAARAGLFQAVGTVGTGYYQYRQLGGKPLTSWG